MNLNKNSWAQNTSVFAEVVQSTIHPGSEYATKGFCELGLIMLHKRFQSNVLETKLTILKY